MAAAAEYDAVVVGGRVSGSSLALLLARQGRRVLVLDRDSFPSDTLSTHLLPPPAVALLARLGALDDVLAAGFRRLLRHRVYVDDCVLEGPAAPGGGFSLAPRRTVLDSVLLEHAARAGAEVSLRTAVTGLVEADGAIAGVRATPRGGESREIRARVVVGADGKSSKVAQWVGAQAYHEVPALRPGYYGYYRGVAPLPQPALEILFADGRLGFLFPMRPNEDCLALELRPGEFDDVRADPRGAFEAIFRTLPGMPERLAQAELEGKIRGTRGIPNFFRVPYGPGWALAGDAAHLKDPSTGTGIGDALLQAFLLSDALGAWLDGADWERTMAEYQRQRDERLLPAYELTLEYTRMDDPSPHDLAWLRAMLAFPRSSRRLAHVLPQRAADLLPESTLELLGPLAAAFEAAAARAPVTR